MADQAKPAKPATDNRSAFLRLTEAFGQCPSCGGEDVAEVHGTAGGYTCCYHPVELRFDYECRRCGAKWSEVFLFARVNNFEAGPTDGPVTWALQLAGGTSVPWLRTRDTLPPVMIRDAGGELHRRVGFDSERCEARYEPIAADDILDLE